MSPNRSPVIALIWKEWHEMRDLVVLMVTLAVISSLLTVLSFKNDWGDILFGLQGLIAAGGGVLFGLRVAAGERGQRTEAMLRGLPFRRSFVATVRLAAGLVGPVLLAFAAALSAFAAAAMLGRPSGHDLEGITAISEGIAGLLLLGAPIYLWTVAAGRSAGSESTALLRVVLLGLGLVTLLVVVVAVIEYAFDNFSPTRDRVYWVFTLLVGGSPLGPFISFMSRHEAHHDGVLLPLGTGAAVSVVALCAWCVARMHATPSPVRKRVVSRAAPRPLGPPLTRRWVSLLGLNLGAPLASAGAVLVLLLLALGANGLWNGSYPANTNVRLGTHVSLWLWAALIHAGLLAVLLFGRETDGQQPWFWRSRPIAVSRWFAVRATTGVVLLVAVHLTPALLDLMLGFTFGALVWPAVWVIPLAAVACFSVVVVATAWSRRAVVILSAAMFFVLMLLVLPDMGDVWAWLPDWNPFTLARGRGWKNGGYPWFVGLCLLLTTTCLLLADSSFRRRVA